MALLLSVRGLSKSYGPTTALAGVDFDVARGEIHALVGQNGAGKSTLIRILAGATRPDGGSVTLAGAPYAPTSPRAAIEHGVATVHQELSLCPHLTVAENILLGREPTRFGLVDTKSLRERARGALAKVMGEERAASIGMDARVGALPLAARQLVEIARALSDDACRVLVLDEPTSSLGRDDAEALGARLRELSARGLGIVYISHFVEELLRVADRFTVLRDGRVVGSGETKGARPRELVEMMTGEAAPEESARREGSTGEVVLASENLRGVTRPERASFELRRGEVLGIAGIVGAGRTEAFRILFGLDPLAGGTLRAFGTTRAVTAEERIAQGMAMLSEDRKREGLARSMSIADNLTLSRLPFFVRPSWQLPIAERTIAELGVRCAGALQAVSELSGGNQQKVALGRLVALDAEVMLLDQPTRGVDAGAKREIHAVIQRLAARGKAILVASDDLEELLAVCDRIAVMRRGALGEARPAKNWTPSALLAEATLGAGVEAA